MNLWLSSSSPTLSQRQALQQAISAALCRCGQTPDRSLELVFEVGEFSCRFPSNESSVIYCALETYFYLSVYKAVTSRFFFYLSKSRSRSKKIYSSRSRSRSSSKKIYLSKSRKYKILLEVDKKVDYDPSFYKMM